MDERDGRFRQFIQTAHGERREARSFEIGLFIHAPGLLQPGEIGAGLSTTIEETAWIQASYLTAEVIIIPLTAWLTRALSTRTLFTISIGLFTVTSLLCGLAWNLESMIVFRVLQGLSDGSIIPLAFSTIYLIFPPEKRAGIVVILALVATVEPTIGPTFGG